MNSFDLKELRGIVDGYTRPVDRATDRLVAARSGIMSLDLNLGGGFPSGLVEVYGPESVGKTALVGQVAAHNQRAGRQVAWLGSERIDPDYLKRLGVVLRYLPVISEQEVGEFLSAFDRAVVIVDSLTAIRPLEVDDWNAFIFDYLDMLRGVIRSGQCVIVTSHVRTRRSVNPGKVYGGGVESASRRLTDLFSCRLEVSREGVTDGHYTQVVKIIANTLASPSRFLKLKSEKGQGVNRLDDLVRAAHSLKVLDNRGSNYYFDDELLGRGIAGAVMRLSKDPELEKALVEATLDRVA